MNRVGATTHRQVLKQLLKKLAFRLGYEEGLDKLQLSDALIALRQRQDLTQEAPCRRAHA